MHCVYTHKVMTSASHMYYTDRALHRHKTHEYHTLNPGMFCWSPVKWHDTLNKERTLRNMCDEKDKGNLKGHLSPIAHILLFCTIWL